MAHLSPAGSLQDRSSALWHLKGFDLFRGLNQAALSRVEAKCQVKRLRRGAVVYISGEPAERVFAVGEGMIKLSTLSAEGREGTLALLGAGEIFGELEVIEDTARGHLATAAHDSVVLSIPKASFLELMRRQQDFAFQVTVRLGQKVTEFQSRISCLLFKGAHSRLSELLLDFGRRYGLKTPEGTRLRYRFSHRDLASLIGVSRETVSHTLGELRRSGILSTRSGHIVIHRPKELSARV